MNEQVQLPRQSVLAKRDDGRPVRLYRTCVYKRVAALGGREKWFFDAADVVTEDDHPVNGGNAPLRLVVQPTRGEDYEVTLLEDWPHTPDWRTREELEELDIYVPTPPTPKSRQI